MDFTLVEHGLDKHLYIYILTVGSLKVRLKVKTSCNLNYDAIHACWSNKDYLRMIVQIMYRKCADNDVCD